jgi:glutathione S-transferase
MYRLYEFPPSGNCYKLRLAMAQLGIEYERIALDITKGETRTDDFLKINPNGRVPVLEIAPGTYLPESNAALWYLAQDTILLPQARLAQAQVLQWMFFEQYSHEPFIATSRYWINILNAADQYRTQLKQKLPQGYAALDVMEGHLRHHPYFVEDTYSVADIALYAYTHVAPEGGFDLTAYPEIRAWLQRIEAQPNYIQISE